MRLTINGRAPNLGVASDLRLARTVLAKARAILLDLDGTLIRSTEVIPGARELLRCCNGNAMIISNNSSDTEQGLAHRLSHLGLDIEPQRFALAGVEAVRAAALRRRGARTMMIASESLTAFARDLGIVVVDHEPEVVLVARSPNFDYQALTRAANAVRNGAQFIVANPDGAHPGPGGSVIPETGALAAAIAAASGREPDIVFGKPEPELFQVAIDRLGVNRRDVVMVGDNAATDGAGASRFGLACILVGDALPLEDIVSCMSE